MATKNQLLEELKGLGVEADPNASHVELTKLLKDKKMSKQETRLQQDSPATPDKPADEPRLQHSEQDVAVPEQEDYLRKYQYRKQTQPGSRNSDPAPGSKAALMKEKLLKQPRVRIFIPRSSGESRTIPLSVTLNGYRLDLPKQTYLELPLQVAEIVMDSQKQTEEAILRNQITGDNAKEAALT